MNQANLRLDGTRVVLRDLVLADLDALAHWLQPGHRWQQLDAPYYPTPSTDGIAQYIAHWRTHIEAHSFPSPRRRAIIADRETDTLLGQVTWYWESEETNWPGIGIVLYDPTTWGVGRGSEALGLWCDYLLEQLPGIARLDLRTWSGNLGMVRLATKLGFVEEARFRKARIVNGEYFDGLGFGVLREEWELRYPYGFGNAQPKP